jgi:hypothetical protein
LNDHRGFSNYGLGILPGKRAEAGKRRGGNFLLNLKCQLSSDESLRDGVVRGYSCSCPPAAEKEKGKSAGCEKPLNLTLALACRSSI